MQSFRLENLLPALNFRIDDTGDLITFVNEVLQPTLDILFSEQQRWIEQQDVLTANENTVDAMLRDLGNPFDSAFDLPIERKRLLVRLLVNIYRNKGTEQSIADTIRAILGFEIVQIVTPVDLQGWELGIEVLGDDQFDPPIADPDLTDFAFLDSDPLSPLYSFKIEVNFVMTQEQIDLGTEVVNIIKPAHTHFLGFIQPSTPLVIDHVELNLSALHDTGEPLQGDEVDLHD